MHSGVPLKLVKLWISQWIKQVNQAHINPIYNQFCHLGHLFMHLETHKWSVENWGIIKEKFSSIIFYLNQHPRSK